MRFLFTFSFVLIWVATFAQAVNFPAIIGLTFENHTLTPASVIPANGQLQPLSPQPTSSAQFISGNSTLDVANQVYYYVAGHPARLYGFDLTSGQVVYNYLLPRNATINYPLSAIQFNPKDSLIYGIRQQTNGLFLVSFDPQSGQSTVLSNQPVAQAIHHAGDATLDTATGTFYLPWGNKNSRLAAIDIQTGQAQTISVSDPLANGHTISRMLNVQFNQADSLIYGLHFSPGTLRFASLDPTTGQVTLLSNGPTSADHFQVGMCTIDEQNQVYYYTRNPFGATELIAVNIATAQVITAPSVSPLNGHSSFVNPEFNSLAQPAARFVTDMDCNASKVHFGNQSLGSHFEWDFGDGNTSKATHPTHRYAQPGVYQVSLTAHAHQQTHTISQQVEVLPALDIELSGPDQFDVGERVSIRVDAGMDSYQWNTGHHSSAITLTHGGTYTVTVTHEGCTATASKQVENVVPFDMDKSSVVTTSYESFFSSSLGLTNPTGKTLSYEVHTSGAGHGVNNTVQTRSLSATGDVSLTQDRTSVYTLTLPPFGTGSVEVNWFAPRDGMGQLQFNMQHPFGGDMEYVLFTGIARIATSVADPTTPKTLQLYPNPAGSGQQVAWSAPAPEPGLIFDALGRKVGSVSQGDLFLSLPDNPGLYIVRLANGQQYKLTVVQ